MLLQKLIQFLYTWEVRLGVILSMSIQIILLLFGSRRKISNATWLKILLWCAYVCADAVAIFSLGLLAHNKEELCKNEPLLNHQLHLLWIPFLILHLGGPDTITAFSLEDNNLWLRHLLNLVIQVGVALYAIIISWNNHNPLTYLVIPILVSGAVRYGERMWALKSASLEQIYVDMLEQEDILETDSEAEGTFTKVYGFLLTTTVFFAHELLPPFPIFVSQGETILEKTSSDAFRLVEDELGLMYDLVYTKASLIYSRLGICLRCLYLVSSVAVLTAFAIIHKHKHNESTWPYPLSDVLITYFLMIGAVILEIYTASLVVLSDWTLIWLDKRQNNNRFAKFLFGKMSTCRGVLSREKRWSRSLKQYTNEPSPTALKRIKDWLLKYYSFSRLMPVLWQMKEFEFEYVSEAGDDAKQMTKEEVLQMMKEVVFKVIKDWFVVPRRRRLENMTFSEFMSVCLNNVIKLKEFEFEYAFDTSLFSWYIVTTELLMESGENTEEPFGSGSHSHSQYDYYKASSKYLSRYLMYLASFRQSMLPPGNYKHLCRHILRKIRHNNDMAAPSFDKGTEQVRGLTNSLTNYFKEPRDRSNNKWEIISSVWAHMLVYAAPSQNKWSEHAQYLRRGGEFFTHVAVLCAHASTARAFEPATDTFEEEQETGEFLTSPHKGYQELRNSSLKHDLN